MHDDEIQSAVRTAITETAERVDVEAAWAALTSRLTTSPSVGPAARARRWPMVAATVAVVATAGVAIAVVETDEGALRVDTPTDDSTIPVATTATSSTVVPPTTWTSVDAGPVAVGACWRSLDRMLGSDPPMWRQQQLLDKAPVRDSAKVLTFEMPHAVASLRVVLVGNEAMFSCEVARIDTDVPVVRASMLGAIEPLDARLEPDEIEVFDAGGSSGDPPGVGPGTTVYVGRAGGDVVAVEAHLPNGDVQIGSFNREWFVIDVAVPRSVPLQRHDQIVWTLKDGTVKEQAATSLLDTSANDFETPDATARPSSTVGDTAPATHSPSGPPLLSVGRAYGDIVGLELRLDDPASINDEHALPSQLELSANIRSQGGPLLVDENGLYGSVTMFSDPTVPNVALLLFGSLQSVSGGATGSSTTTVKITDIVELALADGEQTSVHHIGCLVENESDPAIFAVIPTKASDDSRRVPATRAWRYSRAGLETLDPERVECQLAGE